MVVPITHPGRLGRVRRCGGRHDAPIEAVAVSGEPRPVMRQYAAEHGYEVIVRGSRSATSSHLVHHRAVRTSVPFLIGPATR